MENLQQTPSEIPHSIHDVARIQIDSLLNKFAYAKPDSIQNLKSEGYLSEEQAKQKRDYVEAMKKQIDENAEQELPSITQQREFHSKPQQMHRSYESSNLTGQIQNQPVPETFEATISVPPLPNMDTERDSIVDRELKWEKETGLLEPNQPAHRQANPDITAESERPVAHRPSNEDYDAEKTAYSTNQPIQTENPPGKIEVKVKYTPTENVQQQAQVRTQQNEGEFEPQAPVNEQERISNLQTPIQEREKPPTSIQPAQQQVENVPLTKIEPYPKQPAQQVKFEEKRPEEIRQQLEPTEIGEKIEKPEFRLEAERMMPEEEQKPQFPIAESNVKPELPGGEQFESETAQKSEKEFEIERERQKPAEYVENKEFTEQPERQVQPNREGFVVPELPGSINVQEQQRNNEKEAQPSYFSEEKREESQFQQPIQVYKETESKQPVEQAPSHLEQILSEQRPEIEQLRRLEETKEPKLEPSQDQNLQTEFKSDVGKITSQMLPAESKREPEAQQYEHNIPSKSDSTYQAEKVSREMAERLKLEEEKRFQPAENIKEIQPERVSSDVREKSSETLIETKQSELDVQELISFLNKHRNVLNEILNEEDQKRIQLILNVAKDIKVLAKEAVDTLKSDLQHFVDIGKSKWQTAVTEISKLGPHEESITRVPENKYEESINIKTKE